jgi:hypothetical protein
MARKPKDFDAELQALTERTKKLKGQKTVQLGELVQVTGADALPVEALAGVLLAAAEQAKKQPEAVARWTERGQAFFQRGGKRGRKSGDGARTADDDNNAGSGEPATGAAGHGGPAAAPVGGA